MTGRSVGWFVGWLVAAGRLVGLVSAVTRKRPPRFATSVLSYASNFLYNETLGYEMTNVIKASSHRRSGIPEIFTMGNAHSESFSLPLSFFLVLSSSRVRLSSITANVFIYATEIAYFRIIFVKNVMHLVIVES